jgi:hypothetical protein
MAGDLATEQEIFISVHDAKLVSKGLSIVRRV